jgi:hypothetical protein
MQELEELEDPELKAMATQELLMVVVDQAATIITIMTEQVEQVPQAMPLSTNHPLYFYFA